MKLPDVLTVNIVFPGLPVAVGRRTRGQGLATVIESKEGRILLESTNQSRHGRLNRIGKSRVERCPEISCSERIHSLRHTVTTGEVERWIGYGIVKRISKACPHIADQPNVSAKLYRVVPFQP